MFKKKKNKIFSFETSFSRNSSLKIYQVSLNLANPTCDTKKKLIVSYSIYDNK